MNKKVLWAITGLLIIAAAIYVISFRNQNKENTSDLEGKKLPGDSMTERAIENAANGKPQMDSESLPANNEPKSNSLQNGQSPDTYHGGVILEGSANDLKSQE